MAKLLKTDGEVIENVDISSLEKQQNLVGGYIQYVLLNQLPINDKASDIYGHPLVGNVIDCSVNELN